MEKVELRQDDIPEQNEGAQHDQEGRPNEEVALGQGQVAINQAEENNAQSMARVETDPGSSRTRPSAFFSRQDAMVDSHRSGWCPGIPGVFCWGRPGRDCRKTPKSRLPGAPRKTTDSRARSYRTHRDPAPSPAFHQSADSSPPSFLATWPRRSASASRRYARSTAPSVDVESPHRDVPGKYAPDDRTRDDHQSASTEAAPPSLTPACSAEVTAAASGQSPRWIPRTGRRTSGGPCAGGSAWQECIRTLR